MFAGAAQSRITVIMGSRLSEVGRRRVSCAAAQPGRTQRRDQADRRPGTPPNAAPTLPCVPPADFSPLEKVFPWWHDGFAAFTGRRVMRMSDWAVYLCALAILLMGAWAG